MLFLNFEGGTYLPWSKIWISETGEAGESSFSSNLIRLLQSFSLGVLY